MKKKIASAFALTFLMLLTLAACGPGNTGDPETSGSITQSDASAPSKITIKISTSQLPTQQMGKGVAMLKEQLEQRLGDGAEVLTYDSASLYSSNEEIGACQRNEIQIAFTTGGTMETISEKIQLVKAPYLFPSIEVAYDVLDNSAFADEFFAPIHSVGLTCAGLFSSGHAIYANDDHPLKTPADFVGLKMRAPGTMDSMTLEALGAVAMTTASDETFSAIQQGVIDGMSTPSSVFVPRRFFEVQHYVTDGDNISMQLGYVVMNTNWYEGLSDGVRAKVDEALDATISQMREDIEVSTAQVFEKIEAEGCEVYYLTDAERAQWEAATEAVYAKVSESLGQELIDLAQKCVDESAAAKS